MTEFPNRLKTAPLQRFHSKDLQFGPLEHVDVAKRQTKSSPNIIYNWTYPLRRLQLYPKKISDS